MILTWKRKEKKLTEFQGKKLTNPHSEVPPINKLLSKNRQIKQTKTKKIVGI